jgi:invasion protein IalB
VATHAPAAAISQIVALMQRRGIDLSARHVMKAGDWIGRQELSLNRLISLGDSRRKRLGVAPLAVLGAAVKKGFSAMNFRDLASSVGPRGRLFALLAATALAVPFASGAQAQAPAPAAPKARAPAPRAPAPVPAAPAPGGAPGAQPPAQGQQAADQQIQLIYAPWTKFCLKGQDANAKQVCFIGKDGRIESGQPVVAAVIIEPEGEPKKILRVTLPLGMQLQHGTRIIVDGNQPLQSPYVICFQNGCMSDYEATPDLINSMKKGQNLVIQAINSNGAPLTLPLPLQEGATGSFTKAYDGPPTDPKQFEENQKKLQEELQKRAEQARQKLEQAAPPTAAK